MGIDSTNPEPIAGAGCGRLGARAIRFHQLRQRRQVMGVQGLESLETANLRGGM